MSLDLATLITLRTINILVLFGTMACLLDWRRQRAARYAVAGMGLHGLGWTLASQIGDDNTAPWWLPGLAWCGLLASIWLIWQAMRLWVDQPMHDPRRLWLLLPLLALFGLLYAQPLARSLLVNGVMALTLLWMAHDLWAQREAPAHRVMALCLLVMALVATLRGLVGLLQVGPPLHLNTEHPANRLALVLSNINLLLLAISLMAAYREEAERRLRTLALTDDLTRLLNRRAWNERARALLRDPRRQGQPLVVLMVDLDEFKRINDQHGHAKGDQALQVAAEVLRDTLRVQDLTGRYGGEEFCIALPDTTLDTALALDRRLRRVLRQRSTEALGLPLAYSAGLAISHPGETCLDGLLNRADAALYQAKRNGRGRLEIAPDRPRAAQASRG